MFVGALKREKPKQHALCEGHLKKTTSFLLPRSSPTHKPHTISFPLGVPVVAVLRTENTGTDLSCFPHPFITSSFRSFKIPVPPSLLSWSKLAAPAPFRIGIISVCRFTRYWDTPFLRLAKQRRKSPRHRSLAIPDYLIL